MKSRFTLVAAMVAASCPALATPPMDDVVASYVYEASDASVSVHLKPRGACVVTGSLAKHNTGFSATGVFAPCRYSVEGLVVTVEWDRNPDGPTPPPLQLTFVAEGMRLRLEGEGKRILRRTEPRWLAKPR